MRRPTTFDHSQPSAQIHAFSNRLRLALFLICSELASGQPGEIDTTFNVGVGAQHADGGAAVICAAGLQPDGKILFGGTFDRFAGTPQNYIVRVNRDGTIDRRFAASVNGPVTALSILSDGKILVAVGEFQNSPIRAFGTNAFLVRLNADGTADTNFQSRLRAPPPGTRVVNDILVLQDGRIVVAGGFTNINNRALSRIAILNSDGSPDPTFQAGNGLEDNSAQTLALQPDGRILVGGIFTRAGGQPRKGMARFSLDGALDSNFAPTFADPNLSYRGVLSIRMTPEGKILVGGAFASVNGEPRPALARLKLDGNLDSGFSLSFENVGGFPSIWSMALEYQADGKLLVAGNFKVVDRITYQSLLRLNSDGTLDRGFVLVPGLSFGSDSAHLLAQPDGAIVAAGIYGQVLGRPINAIARIQGGEPTIPRILAQPVAQTQPAGSRVNLSATVLGGEPLAYQWNRNGGPLAGETSPSLLLKSVRVSDSGDYTVTVRNSFGAVTSEPARITIVDLGDGPGSVNALFSPEPDGPVTNLAVDRDGKIVVAGSFAAIGGVSRKGIARLNPDGTVDQSFDASLGGSSVLSLLSLNDRRTVAITARMGIFFGERNERLVVFSPTGATEVNFDLLAFLKAARFDTWRWQELNGVYAGPNGTPVFRYYGYPTNSPNPILTNYFLRLEGPSLALVGTNLTVDPPRLRLSTGKLLNLESEYLGFGSPPAYTFLRGFPDGFIDGSFRIVLGRLISVPNFAVQSDDRLLIASAAYVAPLVPAEPLTLRRYQADGSPDSAFSPLAFGPSTNFPSTAIMAIVPEPSGSALVAGGFSSVAGLTRRYLARVNLGPPPPPSSPTLIDPPESRDALAGKSAVFDVNPEGRGPFSFQWFNGDQPLAGQTNRILIVTNVGPNEGAYSVEVRNSAGAIRSRAAQLSVVLGPGGVLDPSFDPGTGPEDGQINALLIEPDGRILVGGTFTRFNGAARKGLVRLNSDGSIDAAFEAGRISPNAPSVAKLTVEALARHADGRIVFSGQLQQPGETAQTNVFRLRADGTLDPSFRATPGHPPTIMSLAVLPDNRVLLGGTFNYTNKGVYISFSPTENFRNLARLTPDGDLDRTFRAHVNANQSGSFPLPWFLPGHVRSIALAGEKTLVAGAFDRPESSFARLNADGSRDSSFEPLVFSATDEIGRGGVPTLTAMAGGSDGDSATTWFGGVTRFRSDGHRTGFTETIRGAVNALVFQPDGKLIAGGLFQTVGTDFRTNLIRLHRDGSRDLAFGRPTNGPNGVVTSIVLEPSGAILIGGKFTSVDGVPRRGIARLYGSGKVYRQLLQPRVQGPAFSVSLLTLAGRRYTLERAETIETPNWSPVANLDGDGSVKTVSDAAVGLGQRFYRIRVE